MDSINQYHILKPTPITITPVRRVFNTTPCPKSSTGLHGSYSKEPDPHDDEGLHHWITCGFCSRQASAGVDLNTGKIELFYGYFDEIWNDGEKWYSHHSVPVVQPNGEEWCLP